MKNLQMNLSVIATAEEIDRLRPERAHAFMEGLAGVLSAGRGDNRCAWADLSAGNGGPSGASAAGSALPGSAAPVGSAAGERE